MVEGEILRFHYFGLERFFARALGEWTTVTVPYSRIEQVTFRSRWWLRIMLFTLVLLLAGGGVVAFALVDGVSLRFCYPPRSCFP